MESSEAVSDLVNRMVSENEFKSIVKRSGIYIQLKGDLYLPFIY